MEAPSGGPFDVLEGGQFLDAGRADVHDSLSVLVPRLAPLIR
jgi:hypothetical protein